MACSTDAVFCCSLVDSVFCLNLLADCCVSLPFYFVVISLLEFARAHWTAQLHPGHNAYRDKFLVLNDLLWSILCKTIRSRELGCASVHCLRPSDLAGLQAVLVKCAAIGDYPTRLGVFFPFAHLSSPDCSPFSFYA